MWRKSSQSVVRVITLAIVSRGWWRCFWTFPIVHLPPSGGAVSFICAPKNWQVTVYSVSTTGVLVSSSKGLMMDWRDWLGGPNSEGGHSTLRPALNRQACVHQKNWKFPTCCFRDQMDLSEVFPTFTSYRKQINKKWLNEWYHWWRSLIVAADIANNPSLHLRLHLSVCHGLCGCW